MKAINEKKISSIVTIILVFLLSAVCVFGETEVVSINETNFPDEAFRSFVASDTININGDENLSVDEIDRVTSMMITGKGIKNLTGIQYFTNLKSLDCSTNMIETLPILPGSLTELYCSWNELTELNQLPSSLKILDCSGNKITSINALPAGMTTLYCSFNRLTAMPALPETLTAIDMCGNYVSRLDLNPKTAYVFLDVSTNFLESPAAVTGRLVSWCSEDEYGDFNFYSQRDKSSHTWDAGTVITRSSCVSTGIILYGCKDTDCFVKYEDILPVEPNGHEWERDYKIEEASCTKEGRKYTHCQYCGKLNEIMIPPLGHDEELIPGSEATCTEDGLTEGTKCKVCQAAIKAQASIPAKGHIAGETVTTKATFNQKGSIKQYCSVCNELLSSEIIRGIKSVKLLKTKLIYNGKVRKPVVRVKDGKGNKISSKYYKVTYRNNRRIGNATVKIKFTGRYKGTKKLSFQICPAKPTIKVPKAAKKAVMVKWKSVKKAQVTGYQVMAATDKNFTKNVKKSFVKGYDKTSCKMTKLKVKKTYYVRVRTYKTIKGIKIYSTWSKTKLCKTK